MTWRIIAAVLALTILECVLSEGVWAQSVPRCWREVDVELDSPGSPPVPWPLPAGHVCSQYPASCGPYCTRCWVPPSKGCPSPYRKHSCPRDANAAECGQPIDLATGNTFITQTDISLPGLGGGLALSRTWNSIPSTVYASGAHMFGSNWQSTYEDRLVFNTSDGFLTEETGGDDESAFGFALFGPNTYSVVTPANRIATLTTNADTTSFTVTSWTLVAENGEKRVYDPNTGALLSITDRNGNTIQLAYDASNRLITVIDPASRHLNFTYQSSTSNLVTTVSSDVGITLSYSYDSQGRLTKVTKQDNTIVSFQYDGQNRITAVTDNDGKILESHTYDAAGRGLSSSRSNSVDSVTVTYPQ